MKILILLLFTSVNLFAASATAIKNSIATSFETWWPIIVSQQETFRGTNGNYWQGLITHSSIPADGASTAADKASGHPTDQPQSWNDRYTMSPTMQFAATCDVWTSRGGKGFNMTLYVVLSGQTNTMSRSLFRSNAGILSTNSTPWGVMP